jgi:hypothetical protein
MMKAHCVLGPFVFSERVLAVLAHKAWAAIFPFRIRVNMIAIVVTLCTVTSSTSRET